MATMHALTQYFDLTLGDNEKLLLRSSPTTSNSFPSETSSFLNRPTMRVMMASAIWRRAEHSGSIPVGREGAIFGKVDTNAFGFRKFHLVRLTRYVPPSTCTHGRRLRSHLGVIDIIFGAFWWCSLDCGPLLLLRSLQYYPTWLLPCSSCPSVKICIRYDCSDQGTTWLASRIRSPSTKCLIPIKSLGLSILIVVVEPDFDVVQDSHRVIGKDGAGEYAVNK